MKKHITNLSLAAITFVLGGCASYQHTEGLPPLRVSTKTPEQVILKTFGSPGQRFTGVLTVDGKRHEISGVTPAEYPLECIVLIGEVRKASEGGSFGFMIERQNERGRFYTPDLWSLCRFRYYSGSIDVLAQN